MAFQAGRARNPSCSHLGSPALSGLGVRGVFATQGGAGRLASSRSALGWFVAALSVRKVGAGPSAKPPDPATPTAIPLARPPPAGFFLNTTLFTYS